MTNTAIAASELLRDHEPAIRVQSIEKSYKELHVLRGVDFEVAPGRIVRRVVVDPPDMSSSQEFLNR